MFTVADLTLWNSIRQLCQDILVARVIPGRLVSTVTPTKDDVFAKKTSATSALGSFATMRYTNRLNCDTNSIQNYNTFL